MILRILVKCCACGAALIGKFGGGFAGCAYGCYREKSSSHSWGDCLNDCLAQQFSPDEMYEQFKENPAEWIGAAACISCGVRMFVKFAKNPCSANEQRELQNAVNTACKQSGKMACNQSQSLAELKVNRAKLIACQSARIAINTKCFKGGDKGHRNAVSELMNGINKCNGLIKLKGGL